MENKYRLLLAEDDKALRDITALFFSKNGFDVDTAVDGDEACALVDKNRYDTKATSQRPQQALQKN